MTYFYIKIKLISFNYYFKHINNFGVWSTFIKTYSCYKSIF